MRKGKFQPERWQRAKSLAEQGIYLKEACRRIGIHHATGIYISRQMGFTWPRVTEYRSGKQETVGRVERMMRLAGL
jgi:hypothetical protein